ncbi:MAG: transposase [Gammaproteobacteria bacterium]|nr:transposase [Gammaproteobacteria bacterium]
MKLSTEQIRLLLMGLLDDHQAYQARIAEIQSSLWQAHEALRAAYQLQKTELVEYKAQAHYWEAQFGQIKNREVTLQEEIAELKAKLRLRENQLFGRKSEKSTSRADTESTPNLPTKKRGQQPESTGHGRREYSHLPTIEETYELSDKERQCTHCGLAYEEHGTTEEPNVIEIINVQGYRRRIIRKAYQRRCHCRDAASYIDAPGPSRVFPESRLGVSIWAYILAQKFRFQLPLNRILQSLATHGLSLAVGTVTDGMRKLLPLLTPVFDAMVEHNTQASHWHADETGWKVFAKVDGKLSTKWYLWLFQSHDSVVYKCCPSRSSQVLLSHFGENHPGGTLSVDRYSAYKVIAKSGVFVLAFCWAHVRRDFLQYSKNYPAHEAWGLSWVESIVSLMVV